MSIEKAKKHLEAYGFADRVIEFEVSSATVELAAKAIGCEPCMICKSLTFMTQSGAVMVLAAGDAKVDNAKYKAFFGIKAKMLSFDEVESLIGHAVGGVCPFGINDGVKVYLDESMRRFEYIYPAAGSSNSAVKLTLDELEKCSGYISWIDVCKLPEEIIA